jgi:hypothetical protein
MDKAFSNVVERIAADPEQVCKKIVTLLCRPKPALRYPIGPGAKPRSLALRLLPFWVVELIVGRMLQQRAS